MVSNRFEGGYDPSKVDAVLAGVADSVPLPEMVRVGSLVGSSAARNVVPAEVLLHLLRATVLMAARPSPTAVRAWGSLGFADVLVREAARDVRDAPPDPQEPLKEMVSSLSALMGRLQSGGVVTAGDVSAACDRHVAAFASCFPEVLDSVAAEFDSVLVGDLDAHLEELLRSEG